MKLDSKPKRSDYTGTGSENMWQADVTIHSLLKILVKRGCTKQELLEAMGQDFYLFFPEER